MTENVKEIIISKEDAVFWMDGKGCWHNQHGEVEHKKVIAYFNQSIEYDAGGVYVSQARGGLVEKVYFRYQETALFAVDIIQDETIQLLLNTGRMIPLKPENLFIRDDCLFLRQGDLLIKFTDRSMMKLSDHFEDVDGNFTMRLKNVRYIIPEQ